MATTTLFPQPIDYMTKHQLRFLARYLGLAYIAEQSKNSQTKATFVAAIKAA